MESNIAYVQVDADGRPYSHHSAAAARGFMILGYDVRYFRSSELADLPLSPATVVAGGMGTMRAALEQAGAHVPPQLSVPAELTSFLGRASWRTTPAEMRSEPHRFPVFLKPYEDAKVFNGRVVANPEEMERLLAPREGFPPIPSDFPLLAQEPVVFRSEWRVFVIRRRVVGVSHYDGDPLLFPAAGVIRTALGAYQNAPAGYAADFGIAEDGRTLLVELNDGYSLGHGGLVADRYAELLCARWNELTQD